MLCTVLKCGHSAQAHRGGESCLAALLHRSVPGTGVPHKPEALFCLGNSLGVMSRCKALGNF